MRAKLCPFILVSLACAHLGTTAAWAGGRPTHTVAHDSRRLVLPASAHGSSRARAGHHLEPHTAEAAHTTHHGKKAGRHQERKTAAGSQASVSRRRGAASRVADTRRAATSDVVADRATANRVHAWEQAEHQQAMPVSAAAPAAAEQALEAAGAEIAATKITPAEALSPTLPPASRTELPRILTVEEEAATPVLLPSLYDKRGHLMVPPPLYGSHDVLVHQNVMADHDGLTRVRDDDDLTDLRREHKLVPLPANEALHVDERLPMNRRYSRPWTAVFLAVLSRDFYTSFHEPLQLTSAVRTVQTQQRLLRTNGNAAPIAGDTASPHLTGQAVDLGKRGMTMAEIAWLRAYLQPLIQEGKIDVEEEFQQSCFHISVYRNYMPQVRENVAASGLVRSAGSY